MTALMLAIRPGKARDPRGNAFLRSGRLPLVSRRERWRTTAPAVLLLLLVASTLALGEWAQSRWYAVDAGPDGEAPTRNTAAQERSDAEAACASGASPSPQAYATAVMASPGVAGYWTLDDTSRVAACDHARSAVGLYRGGVTFGQASPLSTGGSAVGFDGKSGYVSIPHAPWLSASSAMSIEAWVRPERATPSQTIARKQGEYLLRVSNGAVVFRLWWDDGTLSQLTTYRAVQPGQYQHVAATYDGGTMRIYRNGEEIANRPAAKTVRRTTNVLLLGQSGGYDFLAGSLDEVALYSAALTAEQVRERYELAASR